MENAQRSYRPHNPGHGYHAPGIYLITLVVRNRLANSTIFGRLSDDVHAPVVILSDIGKAVMEEWENTPAIQSQRGNDLSLLAQCCMPDHWHGVVQVHRPMNRSLGHIVQYVKSACTARWHNLTGAQLDSSSSQALRGMSEGQRQQFYAYMPLTYHPLWDDEYDDTICLTDPETGSYSPRHLAAMVRYVQDNPRRAIICRLKPTFMQRCLHIRIAGRDYAAFGNLFLLRWARKIQVQCHRMARFGQLTEEERSRYLSHQFVPTSHPSSHGTLPASLSPRASSADSPSSHGTLPTSLSTRASSAASFSSQSAACAPIYDASVVTRIPYEKTEAFRREYENLERKLLQGATVIVTPGISAGERMVKDMCLEHGYPLIHLQKEAIGAFWKPEEMRFDACTRGTLLILAPWQAEGLGDIAHIPSSTDYAIFHNLNELAREICDFEGDACFE